MTVKQNKLDVVDFFIKTVEKICDPQGGSLDDVRRRLQLEVRSSPEGESSRFGSALQQKFGKSLPEVLTTCEGALSRVIAGPVGMLQVANGIETQPAQFRTPVAGGPKEVLGNVSVAPSQIEVRCAP